MPIVLKYGAPGAIIGAGFAAGLGKRQDRLDAEKKKREEAQADRDLRLDLQQGAFDQQTELQRKAFEQQQNLADEQRQFLGEQRDLDREERAKDRYQKTLAGIAKGELELPGKAQQELTALDNSRVELVPGPFDEQQRQQFMEHYEKRRRELISTAVPKVPVEKPYDERVKENLGENYEQYKGLPWQFNSKGEMSLPSGFKLPQDDQAERDQKFNENVLKDFEKFREEKNPQDPEKKLYATDDEALQAAIDKQKAIERARLKIVQQAGQPATQPVSPPPAQPTAQPTQAAAASQPRAYAGAARSRELAEKPWVSANPQQLEREFKQKWETLNAGESMRGPDGKVYIKQRRT